MCSAGCRLLQDLEVKHVEVDACGDAQSAAEGAMLGLFHYDQLKSKKKTKVTTQLHGRYTQLDHQTGVCDTCKFQHSSYSICLCVFVARTLLAGRGEFFTEKVKTWRVFSWKLQPITSLQQRSPTPLRKNWLPMQNLLQSKRGLYLIQHYFAAYHKFYFTALHC